LCDRLETPYLELSLKQFWKIAVFCAVAVGLASAQEVAPKTRPLDSVGASPPVKIYAAGSGVTAPEWIPATLSPPSSEPCKSKLKGKVELALIVDADGQPRNVFLLKALGSDLDKLALAITEHDRFKPGTRDGSPVAVGQSAEVDMEACYFNSESDSGEKREMLRLLTVPKRRFSKLADAPEEVVLTAGTGPYHGGSGDSSPIARRDEGITQPRLIHSEEAIYTDEARRAQIQGTCVLSMVVDAQGMPQNIRVTRNLGAGLDQMAIEAVSRYRFLPAMKNGQPIPTKISVEVRFRLR
jgi:TonB family protein